MRSMLACRVRDLELLFPFESMERLVPLFDVPRSGGNIKWREGEIPLIRLDEALGYEAREPAIDAGIAVLKIHGEILAVLVDHFLGLVEVDPGSSFTIPLDWILNHPSLPYRAFHMLEQSIVPELAPFHLLISDQREEPRTSSSEDVVDRPGTYLTVSIDEISAAIPVENVEHVLDGGSLVSFPGLPRMILGMLEFRGAPIPVLSLLPGKENVRVIVVVSCSKGFFGIGVDGTHGMTDLTRSDDGEQVEKPPFPGGCDVLDVDPIGSIIFTIGPERIGSFLGI